jgi:hypothetical protein
MSLRALPGPPDATQDLIDLEGVVRRGKPRAHVHQPNGREAASERRGGSAELGLCREKQGDRVWRGRQRIERHGPAPSLERLPVGFVGAPGGGGAAGLGIAGGGGDRFVEGNHWQGRPALGGPVGRFPQNRS